MHYSIKIALVVSMLIVGQSASISHASAQQNERYYGKWAVGTQDNNAGLYASTVNDSGLVMGEYCYFKGRNCIWMVGADSMCEKDASSPTLGNTDQGAAPLVLTCLGKIENTNDYAYVFTNWKQLEALIKKSAIVGLAVPLQGDQFRVWRFSLEGMLPALTDMEGAFFRQAPSNGPAPSGTSTINL